MMEYGSIVIERHRIIEAMERWGASFSIALLDPACLIFTAPGVEGLIGYRRIGNHIVVFGDPVCPSEQLPDLMQAFKVFCNESSNNVLYIAASHSFSTMALQSHYARGALQLINEIVLNPMQDPMARTGKKASLLRNKYNQALRQGILVKEYVGNNPSIEKDLDAIGERWMKARKGPQIYLFSGGLFNDRANKRWFYTEHNTTITGFAMLNKIGGPTGWVLNILIVSPEASSITSEYMLIKVLEILRNEECTHFSIGPSPVERLTEVQGFSSIMRKIFRGVYYLIGKKIFRLGNRQRYWEKFYPENKPSYLLLGKARMGLQELLSIMRALNVNI